jgi:RNA polymerase sigma factor (TIGR02999 family)
MSEPTTSHEITRLLQESANGDSESTAALIRLVYQELHRLAASYMRKENPGHLLQPTALVSEMYMRLFGPGATPQINNRGHFFALAATQMRRVLVDHARHQKKGGGAILVPESEALLVSSGRTTDLVALDDALRELAEVDREAAEVVELRFFGGYTDKETAEILGKSFAKVRRDWEFARAWLYDRLAAE